MQNNNDNFISQFKDKYCIKHFVIFLILMLIILIAMVSRLKNAFEYKTNKLDVSEVYVLQDNKTIIQDLECFSEEIKGISIKFGTYQRINKGEVWVALNENGNPIKEMVYEMEYLVDNSYQDSIFENPIRINKNSKYSLAITAKYKDRESAVAVYISTGGNGLFAESNMFNGTLCYQLIYSNTALQKQILIFSLIVFFLIFILLLLKINFNNFRIGKAVIVSLIVLISFETITIDLLKHINTDIVLKSFESSDKMYTIEPGETWKFTYDANLMDFTSFEFLVEGEQTTEIFIKVVEEETGIEYFNRLLNSSEIITDEVTGKPAILISGYLTDDDFLGFPKGKYNIDFTNMSKDRPVSFSAIEDANGNQIVNASLIKNTWIGHRIAFLLILLLLIYIIFIYFWERKSLTIEKFFLLSVIPLSITYFVLMLPWSAPDTEAHFLATYRLSNILLGNNPWDGRISDIQFHRNMWSVNPDMKGIAAIVFNAKLQIEDANLMPWPNPPKRMEYYSLVCYLPQVLGLCLGRILGLSSVWTIYLARLFMLIVYVLACYNAIKKAPIGKSIFALIPLLPMALMMSSAISYDPLVLITTLNFFACILKMYKEPKSKIALLESMFWTFLIGAIKGGGYLIFLPTVFILLSGSIKKMLRIGLVIGSGIFSVLLFDIILPSGLELYQFGEEASGNLSVSYAFANPLQYVDMCIGTYLKYMDNLIINMGGTKLAWLEDTIPAVIIVGLMLMIGVFSIFEKDQIEFRYRDKVVFLFVIVLEFFITPVMLLSWTPIGNTVIEGVQGRYYLPVLPLIIMMLTKFSLHVGEERITEENRIRIQNNCYIIFALLSCISVYYMMRIYLRR